MALFGSVEELIRQVRAGTRLARGLAYLSNYRAGRLPDIEAIVRSQKSGDRARVEIEGEKLYVLVQCYEPRARETGRFEAHQRYTDLQYLCEGQERIEVCEFPSQPGLSAYDANGNLHFPLGTQAHSRICLQAGRVAVLFPHDAHAPGLRVDEADTLVRKLVIKIHDAEIMDGA
jgi:YhcH/YjgK/YiaL family protein